MSTSREEKCSDVLQVYTFSDGKYFTGGNLGGEALILSKRMGSTLRKSDELSTLEKSESSFDCSTNFSRRYQGLKMCTIS